jgi:hypothetical protein
MQWQKRLRSPEDARFKTRRESSVTVVKKPNIFTFKKEKKMRILVNERSRRKMPEMFSILSLPLHLKPYDNIFNSLEMLLKCLSFR